MAYVTRYHRHHNNHRISCQRCIENASRQQKLQKQHIASLFYNKQLIVQQLANKTIEKQKWFIAQAVLN